MKYNVIVVAQVTCNETRKVVLDLNKGTSFREVIEEEGSFTKFYSNDILLAAYPTNLVVSVEKVEE